MPKLFGKYLSLGREKKVLVTDIDGVLADSAVPVVSKVNETYGLNLKTEDLDNWNYISQRVAELTGSEKTGKEAEDYWFDSQVLFDSPPIAGASEAIEELAQLGWVIWAATSRRPNNKDATLEWIDNYFPEIGSDRVYLREPGMEGVIGSADVKLLAVGMLNATMYTEDDPISVEYVAKNWNHGLVIAMLSRGWNKGVNPELDKYRVDGWRGAMKKASRIK